MLVWVFVVRLCIAYVGCMSVGCMIWLFCFVLLDLLLGFVQRGLAFVLDLICCLLGAFVGWWLLVDYWFNAYSFISLLFY